MVFIVSAIVLTMSALWGCSKQNEEELFSRAEQAQEEGKPIDAIKAYRNVLTEYPDGEHCAKALFMIGFVYSEELADTGKAIGAFEEFLGKYPNEELSASAEFMVKALRGEVSDPVTAEDQ